MLSGMKVLQCLYEKAILGNQYTCVCSRRGQRGERALIECENEIAASQCLTYLKLVRHNSRFALKIEKPFEQLPFGKQSKLLYGSLRALHDFSGIGISSHEMTDIYSMLLESVKRFGSIEALPLEKAARFVSTCETKRRNKSDAR